jgi:hypothetical protein
LVVFGLLHDRATTSLATVQDDSADHDDDELSRSSNGCDQVAAVMLVRDDEQLFLSI